jgi:hypothetical protein
MGPAVFAVEVVNDRSGITKGGEITNGVVGIAVVIAA